MTNNTYDVKLYQISHLESFCSVVQKHVVEELRKHERFSALRLKNVKVKYTEQIDIKGTRGLAFGTDGVLITQTENALQVAGTLVHELAHHLAGLESSHNEDWKDAARLLGLVNIQAAGQQYIEEHFSPSLLAVIKKALEEFAIHNPELISIEVSDDFVIPMPDGKELMSFQKEDVKRILKLPQVLLANEMGTGKTIEVLAAMNVVRPLKVCVVAPRVALYNWQKEAQEFLMPDYLEQFTESDDMEIVTTEVCSGARFTIINYEALNKWIKSLVRMKFDWVVLDEVHMIKTPNAQRSIAARALCESATKVIALSGSPVLNYPLELYPVLLPLIKNYDKTSATPLVKVWPEITTLSMYSNAYTWGRGNKFVRNADKLQAKLREVFMIRRLKKEVLKDLPKKRRQIIEFKVEDAATRKLLDYEKKLFQGKDKNIDDVIEELLAASEKDPNRVSSEGVVAETDADFDALIEDLKFTKQFFFTEISRVRHETAVAKIPYVLEHLENVFEDNDDDYRMVVFAHHKDVLKAISDHFNAKGIKAAVVDGSVSAEKRESIKNDFQNGDLRLFVGGIKAAGVAITLTRAAHACFVELDWSPPIITQAEDRIHRIGSEIHRSILIQHLVFEDSMDSFISKKVVRKQKQIEKMLN